VRPPGRAAGLCGARPGGCALYLLPALACAAFLIPLLLAEARGSFVLRAIGKVGASASFLAFGWAAGLLHAGTPGAAVAVALGLAAAGDLLLLGTARGPFLAGLVAFLLGHLGYLVAFAFLGFVPVVTLLALAVLGGAAALVWRRLRDPVRRLRGPVLAYVAVITAMVAMAAGSFAAIPTQPARAGLLLAAVLFYLSDLCVARQRFVTADPRNRYVGLPLYYAAQLLFAGLTPLVAGGRP
jgi:uncharacterized membrane protein YhhN